jgi:hypothetical protein
VSAAENIINRYAEINIYIIENICWLTNFIEESVLQSIFILLKLEPWEKEGTYCFEEIAIPARYWILTFMVETKKVMNH